MQQVAQALLLYRLTGSAVLLGVMALANAVPQLSLSLFGGVIADRFQKKRLIQIGQSASILMALIIAVALTTGYMSPKHPESWWLLVANSAVQGLFMGLVWPATQSIIPELVGRELLMNAMALNNIGVNVFRLLAPAAAGFLIDATGFGFVFYIMAGLYVLSLIFTSFLPTTR
jgi:MFS family permease